MDISSQSIYRWQRQDRFDEGLEPRTTSAEAAEVAAAKRRIVHLKAELAIANKAVELLTGGHRPKRRFAAIRVMAAEGVPAKTACRMLEVTCGGYYACLVRPPSERSNRHAWLTDEMRTVHADSRQRCGARRIYAEMRLGSGIDFGRG